jgi:hypothetical protein
MLYYINWRLNFNNNLDGLNDFLQIIRISRNKIPKEKYMISTSRYVLISKLKLNEFEQNHIFASRITMNNIKDNTIYYALIEQFDQITGISEYQIFLTGSKSTLTSELKLYLRNNVYDDNYNYNEFVQMEEYIDVDIKYLKKNRIGNFKNIDPNFNIIIRIGEKNIADEFDQL